MTNQHKGTILIVDDVPANLKMLLSYLDELSFKIRIAQDGKEALEQLTYAKPDIILLDIMMPKMDGFEVCRRLKKNAQTSDIPVIFMTALSDTMEKIKGFEMGAVDYITKPFQQEEVLARITTHLNLRSLQLVLEQQNIELREKTAKIEHQAELLRESERSLEKRVREKTRELAESHERLRVLDKAKSDFLNLISHELRTPLNGLVAPVELLLRDDLSRASREDLQKILKQSFDRLLEIIEQAHLITKIEISADNLSLFEQNELWSILDAAAESTAGFAEAHEVSIGTLPDCNALTYCQSELLAKALIALIKTAVKFSNIGKQINISCNLIENEILIGIHATGRTIPEETISDFFEVFSIAKPITRSGDLGLDPPVAARIISLFGGSVSVENREPPGISFTIKLKSAL
ncbi:MAG: hybrid sensor histidine kinase/response regulator [Gammaproteobacteria bacterium]|nr:hybrid sensor histidine kinase/response regulator [Gammaproteobacteria bacterium]